MAIQVIDTTTPQPGGKFGEPIKSAFEKANANFSELAGGVAGIPAAVDAALVGKIPGKNKLINGTMLIWQRGISFNLTNGQSAYTADRWLFTTGASSNINVARQSLAPGEVDQHPLAMAVAVFAVGGGVAMRQSIELVNTSANKTVTVSFWARSNNAGSSLGVRGQQVFGSGGSATTNLGGGGTIALTTSYTRHYVTFSVPSIAGKTAGGNNYVQLLFDFNTSNTTYYITGVQWEEGAVPTAFDYPMYVDELARCMRFYEKSYDSSVYPGTASAFGRCGEFIGINPRNTANSLSVSYKVPKRATPSINIYASENGQANAVSQASGTAVAINGISAVGQTGFQVTYTNGSGQYGGSFHYTADSEF